MDNVLFFCYGEGHLRIKEIQKSTLSIKNIQSLINTLKNNKFGKSLQIEKDKNSENKF